MTVTAKAATSYRCFYCGKEQPARFVVHFPARRLNGRTVPVPVCRAAVPCRRRKRQLAKAAA